MAGESADELARRQREKAERLLRAAERYEQGARGEQATGAILDQLCADGWAVFHDVRWPGRQRANLDHVVVGPPGVFVVDAKNWSGRIELGDQTFRANGRRQDKVVAAAGDAALAVAGLLGPEACAATRSVLCFVRDEPLTGWCHEVMVCSTGNLRETLQGGPAVLTEDQQRAAAVELDLAFRAAARGDRPAPDSGSGTRPGARPGPKPGPGPAGSPGPRSGPRSGPRAGARAGARSPAPVRPIGPRRPRRTAPRRRGGAGRLLALGLVLALTLVLGAGALASSLPRLIDLLDPPVTATQVPLGPTVYEDCEALRADYPDGVGTRRAVRHLAAGGRAPAVQPAVYRANRRLDPGADGIACEPVAGSTP
ncbi:NERD domain-containing protein [Nocardioides panaciterrulae]|uniref:NERD domain-containing protein n=1 Tax=Nocardioides panaciterrulae TaxID=661492 RepID=A0A7Y9JDE7_9ACTN|nr:hypothetical protein [Nocardioides panaciterrulae]